VVEFGQKLLDPPAGWRDVVREAAAAVFLRRARETGVVLALDSLPFV
jgi:hypothetical protein